jgi:hypothetical protein
MNHGRALSLALSFALLGMVGCAGADSGSESEETATSQEAVIYSSNALVKAATYDVQRTTRIDFSIPANQTIDIYVNARESRTDPFAVLYQAVSYDSNAGGHGRVLAYSDDGSGLNPRVHWNNATGANVTATLLVFAYAPSTIGTADIVVYKNGGATVYSAQPVNGTSLYRDNTADSLGTTPLESQSFQTVATAGNPDTFLWVCDLVHQTIAWNDDYVGIESFVATSPAADNLSLPAGSHYPSFVLAGGYSTGGQAMVVQLDNPGVADKGDLQSQLDGIVNSAALAEQLVLSSRGNADASQVTR